MVNIWQWSQYRSNRISLYPFIKILLKNLPSLLETGRKLNVHQNIRRHPKPLLNVSYTFNISPVPRGRERERERRNVYNGHNKDEKRTKVLRLHINQNRPLEGMHQPRTMFLGLPVRNMFSGILRSSPIIYILWSPK